MTLIISLVIGVAIGAFICYAVDLECSRPRNIVVCTIGAVLVGWGVPAALSISGFWVALFGSIIGALFMFWLHQRATQTPNAYRRT